MDALPWERTIGRVLVHCPHCGAAQPVQGANPLRCSGCRQPILTGADEQRYCSEFSFLYLPVVAPTAKDRAAFLAIQDALEQRSVPAAYQVLSPWARLYCVHKRFWDQLPVWPGQPPYLLIAEVGNDNRLVPFVFQEGHPWPHRAHFRWYPIGLPSTTGHRVRPGQTLSWTWAVPNPHGPHNTSRLTVRQAWFPQDCTCGDPDHRIGRGESYLAEQGPRWAALRWSLRHGGLSA